MNKGSKFMANMNTKTTHVNVWNFMVEKKKKNMKDFVSYKEPVRRWFMSAVRKNQGDTDTRL